MTSFFGDGHRTGAPVGSERFRKLKRGYQRGNNEEGEDVCACRAARASAWPPTSTDLTLVEVGAAWAMADCRRLQRHSYATRILIWARHFIYPPPPPESLTDTVD
jgi:hypothetical protein